MCTWAVIIITITIIVGFVTDDDYDDHLTTVIEEAPIWIGIDTYRVHFDYSALTPRRE